MTACYEDDMGTENPPAMTALRLMQISFLSAHGGRNAAYINAVSRGDRACRQFSVKVGILSGVFQKARDSADAIQKTKQNHHKKRNPNLVPMGDGFGFLIIFTETD